MFVLASYWVSSLPKKPPPLNLLFYSVLKLGVKNQWNTFWDHKLVFRKYCDFSEPQRSTEDGCLLMMLVSQNSCPFHSYLSCGYGFALDLEPIIEVAWIWVSWIQNREFVRVADLYRFDFSIPGFNLWDLMVIERFSDSDLLYCICLLSGLLNF